MDSLGLEEQASAVGASMVSSSSMSSLGEYFKYLKKTREIK